MLDVRADIDSSLTADEDEEAADEGVPAVDATGNYAFDASGQYSRLCRVSEQN
jgi:hypothetical protein